MDMNYSLTVGEPCLSADGAKEQHFYIQFGPKFELASEGAFKRWARRRVEQEWGAPVKNPTQKRAWYTTYFSVTELIADRHWHLVITQPKVG
jgi:hypothetical protein